MKWLNVTCDNSHHIVEAQKHLFKKYVGIEPIYLDVKDTPIDKWGVTVASMLPNDEFVVFGLDDFMPIDYLDEVAFAFAKLYMEVYKLDRFELSYGASHKIGFELENGWLRYGTKTPYKVSCQFSVWRTEVLKRELKRTTTPWKFETHGICDAGCFTFPVLRYIEESTISGRQQGKINLCGLRLEDENELIELGLIDKNKVIYGWKGTSERTESSYGTKYKAFY